MTFLRPFINYCWLFCLVLLLPSHTVFSAASVRIAPAPSWVVPVTPGGKAPSAKQFSDGYYVAFSDKQIYLDKQTSYSRVIRHIASETGVQNGSEFSVSFDPSYERVDFHTLIVWRDGQATSRLNLADFKILPLETDRQRFIYNGYYSASIILKDIRKGDRIEFSWSRTGWNPIFKNKFSSTLSFGGSDYMPHVHCALIAAKGRNIQFKEFNKAPKKTQKSQNGATIYEWESKNVLPVKYEDYSPSWYDEDPYVQITEFKNWSEVVEWGLQFYQVPEVRGALKAKVDQWKKIADSKHRYVELATRFVQDEIRYLGIETGENSHRPHDPEAVFAQRYGDCKDKAFLLCAMLRANDIICDPVLVNTYKRAHLNDYLPSPTDFNHVVVRVNTGEKRFIFIDATYSLQGGTASTTFFPFYGEGLLLKKGETATISMPSQNMGPVEIVEEMRLRPRSDTSNLSQLMVKTVYHGSSADNMRTDFQEMNLSKMEEDYLNYYRDIFKKVEVEPSDTIEYYDQREANNFSIVERYTLQNPWVYDSTRKNYYFSLVGKMLYNQLIMLPGRKREEPVSLSFPYAMDYTMRVHFDRYNNITEEDWSVERGSYTIRFKSKVNEQEKAWDLSYEYKILKDHVPLAEVPQFKDDINRLVKSLDYEIRDTEGGGSSLGSLNYWMIFVILISFVFGIILCKKLYRYSPGSRFATGTGIAFGGWLVLLAITLILQPFAILISLATDYSVYLTDAGWASLNGQSEVKILLFHCLLVVESVINVFFLCGSIFLIYILFDRRDSFPRIFTIFFIAKLLILIVDTGISVALFDSKTFSDASGDIVKLLIYCAIWVSYVNGSPRVENTFVNESPGKTLTQSDSGKELAEGVAT